MQQTLRCPGCDAELVLPASAAEQAVQCPRCRRVFRGSTSKVAATPAPSLPSSPPAEDHEHFEPTPVIAPRGKLMGWWIAVPTMVLIAATIVPISLWGYVCYEEIELKGQGKAAFRDGRWADHFRFSHKVGFWAQASGWPAYFAFAIWSAAAARNARLLQAIGMLPAFTLLLSFFCCPLLNAVIGYINLQDVWRSSDPHEFEKPESWRRVRPSPWIRACGLMYVSVPFLVFLAFRFDAMGRQNDVLASILLVIANLTLAAANILLVAIIANITIRQRQRYIRLYEDPA